MLVSKTKRWGNSLGIIIPKEAVKELGLIENQEIVVDITKRENPLKELFGAGKDRLKQPTQELLKELRKNTSKYL